MKSVRRYEGYHDVATLPIKAGDVVTIFQGVKVSSSFSRFATRPAGLTYRVMVHHLFPGESQVTVDDFGHERHIPIKPPAVVWMGTGGYWSSVDINDVPEATQECHA